MQCLNDACDVKDLDAEVFQRLVVTARNVAVSRPTNLVRFAEKATSAVQTEQRKHIAIYCRNSLSQKSILPRSSLLVCVYVYVCVCVWFGLFYKH